MFGLRGRVAFGQLGVGHLLALGMEALVSLDHFSCLQRTLTGKHMDFQKSCFMCVLAEGEQRGRHLGMCHYCHHSRQGMMSLNCARESRWQSCPLLFNSIHEIDECRQSHPGVWEHRKCHSCLELYTEHMAIH